MSLTYFALFFLAPEFLDAPKLFPGKRNILVTWSEYFIISRMF